MSNLPTAGLVELDDIIQIYVSHYGAKEPSSSIVVFKNGDLYCSHCHKSDGSDKSDDSVKRSYR